MSHERTLTAPQTGPISIDASLLGTHGTVTVRADATATAATIAIRIADETGSSADAVREARLHWDARGALVASVEGSNAQANVLTGGGVQVIGHNYGVISQTIVEGVVIGGTHQIAGTVSSPVEIAAVVPEGSSVLVRTGSADIRVFGLLTSVAANTQSGDVAVNDRVEQAIIASQSGAIDVYDSPSLHVQTQTGTIRLGRTDLAEASTVSGPIAIGDFGGTARLHTVSGAITVHATTGGDITAQSVSGDITVNATDQAQADNLDVIASSVTGAVRAPYRRTADGPRRRTH
ncbi:DUF4097 family beta strand repeat-containing protein [Streptomyces sp. NPDC088748]|uniref:DUF4097 family beta strand repeat-containing protein n=1 Tax=Streptomyces sp. NPDC088748 TaxID=3365887 RepID=UPI0037F55D19